MLSLAANEIIFYEADSLRAGFGGCAPVQGSEGRALTAGVVPAMPTPTAPFQPTPTKRPRFVIDAASGRATTDIGATMAAQLLPYNRCTAAIIALGINDADKIRQSLETVGQFTTASLQILDALNSIWGIPYAKMLWIGPWAHDSGDDVVAIGQVYNEFTKTGGILSLRPGLTLVNVSGVVNTPLGTMTIGDGTHPLAPASDAMAAITVPNIQLAA